MECRSVESKMDGDKKSIYDMSEEGLSSDKLRIQKRGQFDSECWQLSE